MSNRPGRTGLHPIQVVVRRAGISADVLRAWERRYGAVTPTRSETGRRLYSESDVERLRLIKEAIAGGRRIGDVATLPTEDLARLVVEDREQARVAPTPEIPAPAADVLMAAIAAVRRADQATLRGVLSRSLLLLAPARFIEEVATPLMHQIGDLWERGALSPGHEHIASEVMRQLLTEVVDMVRPANGSRALVVGTPSGQRHELGALLAATTAALLGWRVTYLGVDLPASDIARVAVDIDAAAIALSVTTADPSVVIEMASLRRAVGRDMSILVGGQEAAQLDGGAAQAITLPNLDSLRSVLASLSSPRK